MLKSNISNTTEMVKKLDDISVGMNNLIDSLDVIENSLFFATERADKDMTKPCAAAIEVVRKSFEELQEGLEEVSYQLKAANVEV